MDEELYYLWLGMFPNMMNKVITEIVEYFGGVHELWNVDEAILRKNLSEKRCQTILRYRDEKIVKEYKKRLDERKITYVYPGHPSFPEKLLNIPDPPNLLYAKGNIEELNNKDRHGIAIVGARKASAYGLGNASLFAGKLAEYNIAIISGMASGIDGAAHKEAVENGGFSIAVLGCGINICYPKENYKIFEKLCNNGVVLSEYGLDVMPEPWRFPPRNRIISGLSDGVLIIEAREKSGSLITADQALEQGRDVYAIPGSIHDANSKGSNNLIKMGAICVTEPQDIIRNMGLDEADRYGQSNKKQESSVKVDSSSIQYTLDMNKLEAQKDKELTDIEKQILSCITYNPIHIEKICQKLKLSVSEILHHICDMERKKIIRQPSKNYFILY